MSLRGVFSGRAAPGMRYAAARALAAAAAGVAIGRLFSVPLWLAVVIAALAVGLLSASRGWSLYLAVAAAALGYAQVRTPLPADPRLYATGRFDGVVVFEAVTDAAPRVVAGLSKPWHGKVTLWFRDSSPRLRVGDVVRVFGRVRPLDLARNPGVSDFNSVLAGRGFVGSTSVSASDVVVLTRGDGLFFINRQVASIRRHLLNTIDRLLPSTEGALLVGLLLGGSQGLPEPVQEAFRDSGIVHILAVSGMNVSIIVGVLWLVLSLLGVRGWWRFCAGVAGVVLYLLLVGWSAAPARAGLMACAVLLSVPTQRRVSPVASLCAAGILLLLVEPSMLFDVGAQLSFCATLGIVLAAVPAQQVLRRLVPARRLVRWVLVPVVVSLAAALATAPLLLHHFSRVQPLAFMTSAAVVPLVGLAMPLGIMVLLADLVSSWVASTLAQSLWLVLFALLKLTVFMGELDWAIWEPGRWSWPLIAWVYLLGLLAFKLGRSWARVSFAALLLAGLNVIIWQSVLGKPETKVTFLDPRQGDAILLEDSVGQRILFDAGVDGTGVLREYLRSRGIHRLDAVVVTHPDRDHYGGLLDLSSRFRVQALLVPTLQSQDTCYQSLLQRLRASGTEVVAVGRGAHLEGFGFRVDFLWPDDATMTTFLNGAAGTNDLSLVAMAEHGGFRMLLTGDLDDPDLVSNGDLRADLLKAPHHGSMKGNEPSLYERVQPDYVVVMGRYPTPARLGRRFDGTAVTYVNTRVDGAVMLHFVDGSPSIQRFFARLPFPGE